MESVLIELHWQYGEMFQTAENMHGFQKNDHHFSSSSIGVKIKFHS
jgi:hypothetical protein